MRKMNKTTLLLIALFTAFMLAGCKNPSNTDKTEETISAGWYVYTTNANSAHPQSTYLYINTSGNIERAGSSSNEYTDTQLKLLQNQLSYTVFKKNADGVTITFEATEEP